MKCFGGGFSVHGTTRAARENFLVLAIAFVDEIEIPRPGNDIGVTFAGARTCFQQQERFNIYWSVGEE